MAAVARFLERPNALLYAQSCERYGVDPGGFIDDEFLALQLRVGAAVATSGAPEEPAQDETTAPFEAARKAGRELREAIG